MIRRRRLLGAAVAGMAASSVRAADAYPVRPIRIVLNTAAGGQLDVTTRAVAQRLAETLGQPVIIDNRPGADGQLAIRHVKASPADGYTLLASANTFAQLPAMKLNPGYELSDFTGIGVMSHPPLILVTAPSQPDRTLADLLARAKAKPDALTYASAGVGTGNHMATALLLQHAGIQMRHVPYKGNPAALVDVMAGRVDVMFDGGNIAPAIRDGRVRALGVASPRRSPAVPGIPTIAEQGLPGYSFVLWHGLLAPAATPREVVQRLAAALHAALASESVQERLRQDGGEAGKMTPEQFTDFFRQDYQRTVKVVEAMGMARE